jgi:adenylate cyclase
MKHTFIQKLGHIGRVILAWSIAYGLFGFFRMYGMGDAYEAIQLWDVDLSTYVLQLLLASIITGLLYGAVDLVLDRPAIQRWSYGRLLALKGIMHSVIILIILTFLMINRVRLGVLDTADLPETMANMLANKSFQVFVVFFLITSWMLNVYQQVNEKFGKGVLLDMLRGRYHKPKEADRIFMFIDLKSSVRIAEVLGHVRYSSLLQDCYFLLNTQLSRYKAGIYQYVGDEVVLYWHVRPGLEHNNCVHCFYGFLRSLQNSSAYFEAKYGVQPFFKAGAHLGRVTIAEVGVRKREIAFHGDTVNTTSRIQDQCANYEQRLLISKDLYSRLQKDHTLHFVYIGDKVLKGRHQSMEMYGVEPVHDQVKTSKPDHSKSIETDQKAFLNE